MMTALGNSTLPMRSRTVSVRGLIKRKRCLPSIDERNLVVGKKLKVVYTATVPSKHGSKLSQDKLGIGLKLNSTHIPKCRKSPSGYIDELNSFGELQTISTTCERQKYEEVDELSMNSDSLECQTPADAIGQCLTECCRNSQTHMNPSIHALNSSAKQSHQDTTKSSRQNETTSLIYSARIDFTRRINSDNDIKINVGNISEKSSAVICSHNTTKVASKTYSSSYKGETNKMIENSLCRERLKSIDVKKLYPKTLSESSIQFDNDSNANNKVGIDVTVRKNNATGRGENAQSQNFPTDSKMENVCEKKVSVYSSTCSSLSSTKTQSKNIKSLNQHLHNSVLKIKTISTEELVKFLSRYNLTLEAVPIDGKMLNTMNKKCAKTHTIAGNANINKDLQNISSTNKCKTAIPVESDMSQRQHSPETDTCLKKDPLATLELRCVGNTVFRTTRQGIFSDWKIDGARCAKMSIKTKAGNGNVPRSHMKTENRASSNNKRLESGQRNDRKRFNTTKHYVTPYDKQSSSKVSDTSQLKMFPLLNAFHDLAARDKATKETLEIARAQVRVCPLSPRMHSLINNNNTVEDDRLQSDPMLTAAVATDSSDPDEDDFISDSDLELSRDSLPYPDIIEKFYTNLNDMLINSRSSGQTNDNLSRLMKCSPMNEILENKNIDGSCGKKRNVCNSESIDFYEFPHKDKELESAVDRIPDISLKSASIHSSMQQNGVAPGSVADDIQYDFNTRSENYSDSSNEIASTIKSTVLNVRKCAKTSSKSTAHSHCSISKCVTSTDCCTKDTKITQVETLEKDGHSDKLVFDNINKKPVENWNSEEVTTWLNEATAKFTTSLKTHIDIAAVIRLQSESNNPGSARGADCFKTITDGRTLRNLTLDKLREQFGSDSLSRYLFNRIQELLLDRKVEAKNKNNNKKDMYRRGGHCTVVNPHIVPVTSAEQLEESVNFEDLLGFDNILGPLELTDVLDSHASFLNTPGSEGPDRFSTQQSYQSTTLPAPRIQFECNRPTRKNSRVDEHNRNLNIESNMTSNIPSSLAYSAEYYSDTDSSSLGRTGVNHGYCSNEHLVAATYYNQSLPPTPALIFAPNGRSVSPSTFYNLSTATPTMQYVKNGIIKDEISQRYGTNTHPEYHMFSEKVTSPTVIRDMTMSDTDSGIHSPGSTPNKYLNSNATTFNTENNLFYHGQDTPSALANDAACKGRELVWMNGNGSVISPNTEDNVATKIYSMPKDPIAGSDNSTDSNQESWEICSDISTSSTLSAESETKLFNMDDCKTYIAGGPLHSRHSYKCLLQEEANLFTSTVNTPDGSAVFVSPSDNNKAKSSETKATQHMVQPNSIKRPLVVTNGSITTVYPSFVSHIRNSTAGTQANNASQFQKHIASPDFSTCKTAVNLTGINRERFHKLDSIRSNTLHGRRIASDDSEETIIDSFDIKIRRTSGKSVHLWEFIRDTLLNPLYCPRLIKWENREAGIFRFVQSDVVAGMWGERKNNPKMTYEKLSRAMRYYYNREILERVDGRRLVYKFGKNAHGWRLPSKSDNDGNKSQQNIVKEEIVTKTSLAKTGVTSPSRVQSSGCKIVTKLSDDVLSPSPYKKRRVSIKDEGGLNISNLLVGQSKLPSSHSPLNAKISGVEKECITLLGIKQEHCDDNHQQNNNSSDKKGTLGRKTPRSSCIVYLARPNQLSGVNRNEERNVFKAEVGHWSSKHTITSPSRQSKLPSAEVLLGKQYKVATVAI